jgi:uncharacterized protein
MSKQLAVPFSIDSLGRVSFIENPYRQIAQRLEVLIGTQLRTRVMLADYGVAALNYLFEPLDADTLDADTRDMLVEEIRVAIQRWEPRVEVHDIIAEVRDDTTLSITVYFSMLDANQDREVHTADVLVGGTVVTLDA